MSQAPPVDVARTETESEISLGRELRRAREVRGITIEQIARETKINERYLHALENDRLDLLPGELYARNFVRAVARTIGADEEELLDYFNYQVRMSDDRGSSRDDARGGTANRRGMLLAVAVAGGVLLVVVLTLALRPKREAPATPQRPQRATSAPAPAPVGAPAATPVVVTDATSAPPPAAATGAAPDTAARPLPPVLQPAAAAASPAPAPASTEASDAAAAGPAPSLRVTFTEQSWVEIQREGDAEPLVGLKQRGETLTYSLDKPVSLTILNSAGASLSVDGQPFRALGGPQEKRTITVDRKNFSQYLKR